jgi:bis(5'-nucleosidyl)-tetraphosphatase
MFSIRTGGMAIDEHSAGLVVFRRQGREARHRLYLLLDYGQHWDFPKGHIEAGETPLDAALRELTEETGIADPRIVPGFAQEITYFFRDKKKGLVRKTVIFFLAQTDAAKAVISDEHVGYAFDSYEPALRRLTFASAKQVLRQAEKFLNDATPVAP